MSARRQLRFPPPLALTGAAAICLVLAGCARPEAPSRSANARPEIVDSLRADLATPRHPSDGGGTAALVAGPETIEVGALGTWTFTYTAGRLGIDEGGWLFFQVSPFWNWSTPQVADPRAPGYTEVTTDAAGVELEPTTVDRQLLGIRVAGRALAEGEVVRLIYGAGGGARVDSFAERRSPFYFAVDGDGDGVRGLLAEPLTVDVTAGPAARLQLTLPAVARPAAPVRLRVGALDAGANGAEMPAGRLELVWRRLDDPEAPPPAPLPNRLDLLAGEPGLALFAAPTAEGLYEVTGTLPSGVVGWSAPMMVSADRPQILWGDLHGHSNFSDGTATPEQYFRYARDVAGLDLVALTDHDHWGLQPLAHTPELWEEIRRQVAAFHAPGEFVTLLGYEWTSWLHGHRHVLYFEDDGPVLSSVDPRYETPAQLWDALRGLPALTFAHHSAGEPIATDWSFPPDPELEPVTEIVSVHGVSEAGDAPGVVRGPIQGNFVRDVLERGYRLGFIGSGDGHDGHPGLTALANPSGGLAALLSDDLSREGARAALRERRVYATNGARILLWVELDGAPMGRAVPPARSPRLDVTVAGTAPLRRLDIVRVGEPIESVDLEGRRLVELERTLAATDPGDVLYVRVLQRDGGIAWSSPHFVDRPQR